MPISSTNLAVVGGTMVVFHTNTPLYCGIFIPLGILILFFVFYFICSRNNMDLPGAVYIPPNAPNSAAEATEMKDI